MINWDIRSKCSYELIHYICNKYGMSFCESDDCNGVDEIVFVDSLFENTIRIYPYYGDSKNILIESNAVKNDFDFIFFSILNDDNTCIIYEIDKNDFFNIFVNPEFEDEYYSGELDVQISASDKRLNKYKVKKIKIK